MIYCHIYVDVKRNVVWLYGRKKPSKQMKEEIVWRDNMTKLKISDNHRKTVKENREIKTHKTMRTVKNNFKI